MKRLKAFWCRTVGHSYNETGLQNGYDVCDRCNMDFTGVPDFERPWTLGDAWWRIKCRFMYRWNNIRWRIRARFTKPEDDVPF